MEIALKGKVAIVTGAGRGIGREIAETLGREGAVTVVTDVRPELLDDVADVFRREGWSGRQYICDVRDRARTQAVVDDVVKAFGRVDVLVNNAGVAPGGPVETLSEEAWDLNLDVNLKGTFLMCQAVIPDDEAPALRPDHQRRVLRGDPPDHGQRARTRRPRRACTTSRAPWRASSGLERHGELLRARDDPDGDQRVHRAARRSDSGDCSTR